MKRELKVLLWLWWRQKVNRVRNSSWSERSAWLLFALLAGFVWFIITQIPSSSTKHVFEPFPARVEPEKLVFASVFLVSGAISIFLAIGSLLSSTRAEADVLLPTPILTKSIATMKLISTSWGYLTLGILGAIVLSIIRTQNDVVLANSGLPTTPTSAVILLIIATPLAGLALKPILSALRIKGETEGQTPATKFEGYWAAFGFLAIVGVVVVNMADALAATVLSPLVHLVLFPALGITQICLAPATGSWLPAVCWLGVFVLTAFWGCRTYVNLGICLNDYWSLHATVGKSVDKRASESEAPSTLVVQHDGRQRKTPPMLEGDWVGPRALTWESLLLLHRSGSLTAILVLCAISFVVGLFFLGRPGGMPGFLGYLFMMAIFSGSAPANMKTHIEFLKPFPFNGTQIITRIVLPRALIIALLVTLSGGALMLLNHPSMRTLLFIPAIFCGVTLFAIFSTAINLCVKRNLRWNEAIAFLSMLVLPIAPAALSLPLAQLGAPKVALAVGYAVWLALLVGLYARILGWIVDNFRE